MLSDALKLAMRNIKRRKLRSMLTMLGIAVGIASIVLFVSVGEGIKNLAIASLGEVGNELVVTPGIDSRGGVMKLGIEDVRRIEKIPGVAGAAPRLQSFMYLEYRGRAEPVLVLGVDAEREKRLGVRIAEGRFLKGSDRYAAVLGYSRQNVSSAKGAQPLKVKLRQRILLVNEEEHGFRVVGVLEEGGLAAGILSGADGAVILPLDTLKKIAGVDEVSHIVVKLEEPRSIDRVTEEIEETTGGKVISMKQVVESVSGFFRVIQIVFFVIGSVALIVAGFGIMNTMMMSVLERTREIGILKAIGAKRRDVLYIFLAEAGLMGLAGGVMGAGAGVLTGKIGGFAVALLISEKFGTSAHLEIISTPAWLIAFSLIFSVTASIIFGLYPAWRAASLEPAEALRQL
ncbi:MAG: ABC transporter permease [Deferribacteres bacterium]|nr:ABC transporter permease [Deferribacteres bacterium]